MSIFRTLFPWLIRDPKVGERWVYANGNPFSRKIVHIEEIKEKWVKYKGTSGTGACSITEFKGFYKNYETEMKVKDVLDKIDGR